MKEAHSMSLKEDEMLEGRGVNLDAENYQEFPSMIQETKR